MLNKALRIGDKVVYDEKPDEIHTVIGFRGDDSGIAILDTMIFVYNKEIQESGMHGAKNKEHSSFIWKFMERGKTVYNQAWTLKE